MGPTTTKLVQRVREGDKQAVADLMAALYDQLRSVARRQMSVRPPGGTLTPTGLVNEAFLKLQEAGTLAPNDRDHFFAIAAQSMRWILNERMDAKRSAKRGGRFRITVVTDIRSLTSENTAQEIGRLTRALAHLEKQDKRVARVVELRFLGGYSNEEVATVLSISLATVKRDWTFAKTWLLKELAK